ncbi:MAG: beta-N-acetylhexosaminidase [Allosphingosinicella sp.]|uniref:beta-N-acetylhexosaminidase n=1 Tax=Allosphingosinicella sp. TaxID=2823234 RepID=UPI00394630D1
MLPVIFGLSGPVLTADECAFFRAADPAGYILFARNCRDPEQLRALTDTLRDLSGRAGLLLLVDQEGGRVARLGPPAWPAFPAPARFGALYAHAPMTAIEAARLNAMAMGATLRGSGLNVACAPVLDLAGGHDVIGDRAFGADPVAAASLGRAVLDGLAAAGVAGVMKHMPGHGRATADSHGELPRVAAAAEAMAADLLPFRRLAARARIGMVAHVAYASWDAARPASLSAAVIEQVIRGAIGFDGLLLSDDIGMGALSGTPAERARGVLAAGCDLALHCSGRLDEAEAIAVALPPIGPEAAARLGAASVPDAEALPPLGELLSRRDALLAAP